MGTSSSVIVYPVKDGLYVNLTNRCPCACRFCIRQNGDGVYGSGSLWLSHEPSAAEVVSALQAAGLASCRELVFCGYGEPTERIEVLVEVARHVKSVRPDLPVRVNTNGLSDLIHGRPTASDFVGCVDAMSISLNAATGWEYYALCRPKFGPGSWEAMLAFAAEVKKYVPDVVMTVVGTPDFTPEKRQACEAVCARIGVPLRVRTYEPPETHVG